MNFSSFVEALRRSMIFAMAFIITASIALTPVAKAASTWPKDLSSWDDITSLKLPLEDPGPRPSFDPAEYAPYEKTGPGIVDGTITVSTTHGTYHCGLFAALLVPATDYTTWLSRRVAQIARTTENPASDDLFTESLPSWMMAGIDAKPATSAIRKSGCASNGYFKFTNLPLGSYLFYMVATIDYLQTYHGGRSIGITMPDGEFGSAIIPEDEKEMHLGDSFMLGSPYQIDLTQAHPSMGIRPQFIGTYAHMHSRENYPSSTAPMPAL